MPIERSAGAIIIRKDKGRNLYLLLHYPTGARTPNDFWDLPKGHIERGETETEAAMREVREETGLKNIKILNNFKETIKYFFKKENKTIFKTVVFYLAETTEKKVQISREHIGYKWLLYDNALNTLTFDNAKGVLKKANDSLAQEN